MHQVIAALQQRGLVEVLPDEDGQYRYVCSLGAAASGRGCLVCRSCGLAITVASPLLMRLQLDLQLRYAFRLTRAELELRALCDPCANAGQRTTQGPAPT
jgi:Fe2+ or Zn2+ uptake regulation protein